jgi:FKBP-type peptidyl-prolyl cis-trans isomerase
MKQIIILIAACIITQAQAHAQYIKNKSAFAKAFIAIFSQRENGFDSLKTIQGEDDTLKNPSAILPNADLCYISTNSVFGASYKFTDSTKAEDFFKELKELINYVSGMYNATSIFEPLNDDPFYLSFYFRDASGYTNNQMTISLSQDNVKKNDDDDEDDDNDEEATGKTTNKSDLKNYQGFEVLLLIHPGSQMCYFTSYGNKIIDETYNSYINQLAFGSDTTLAQFKTNKRVDQQKNILYDSKLNLKGFSTRITEVVGKKATGIHITASRVYTAVSWEKFENSVDSFILKLKAALPPDFVYCIYPDDYYVEFTPSHFVKSDENIASIILSYSPLPDKKNSYALELEISRTYHSAAQKTANLIPNGSFSSISEKFLNDNSKKPGVKTTASGLQYVILKKGSGPVPGKNDECVFHCKGTLVSGTEFDNTYTKNQPWTAKLSSLIQGMQEGLQLMPAGSIYKFFIPPALAYGENQAGKIPPGSVLIYKVELIRVKKN